MTHLTMEPDAGVPQQSNPTVSMRNIEKHFGHVVALRDASFDIHAAKVNALVGDNGAGKSTLIKVLSGTLQPDAGQILVDGVVTELPNPLQARERGIETVYQDLALCTHLDPASNVFLGRELLVAGPFGRLLGFLDFRAMRDEAAERLARLQINLGAGRGAVETLSGGQRQAVAIARAIFWSRRILVLDEPTAALGVKETELVLDLIRRARDSGIAVVLIMHNLPQVFEVADRITVLSLGRDVGSFEADSVNMSDVVSLMTGVTAAAAGSQ